MPLSGDRPSSFPGLRGYRPPEGGSLPSGQETLAEQEIDLQSLAEEVYALLKEELRVERERLGRNRC